MTAENALLKQVQDKLAEKEEIIREQQRQINELTDELDRVRGNGGNARESVDKDQVIHEQMRQILELQEQIVEYEAGGGSEEQEEIIREQMQQILELTEQVDKLEQQLKGKKR